METPKPYHSPSSHLSMSPTLRDADEAAPDAQSSSSGTSPPFHYDGMVVRPPGQHHHIDKLGSGLLGLPAPSSILAPYDNMYRSMDFSGATASLLNSPAPHYFYSPAVAQNVGIPQHSGMQQPIGMQQTLLPLAFNPYQQPQQLYYGAASVLPGPRLRPPGMGHHNHPSDDLTPEKYSQLASEFIAQDDARSTPSPRPEATVAGMQPTTRPTPSSSTVASGHLEFEAVDSTAPLYNGGSMTSSSGTTTYMQHNYEFQLSYEPPAIMPPMPSDPDRHVRTERDYADDDADGESSPRQEKGAHDGEDAGLDSNDDVNDEAMEDEDEDDDDDYEEPSSPSRGTPGTPTSNSKGSGNYHCPQCGKSFKQNGHMRRHRRSHDGEESRIHACPIIGCVCKYYRRDHLRRHFQAHMASETKANGAPPALDEALAAEMSKSFGEK
ncbi:hypothetical protein DFJ74DRAFT_713599 [Hyaloraphidium curvatum]|nr:hypothetical protein DFJ74DRAFT_713599 [Hyaloraphidium curvatum]